MSDETPSRRYADKVLESMSEDIKTIKVILTGNGTPERGMVMRTTMLEGRVGGLEEVRQAAADDARAVRRSVIGWALTLLGAIALAYLGLK